MKRKTSPYTFNRLFIPSIAKLNTGNTRKLIAIIAFMFSFLNMSAQYTSIPDTNFEAALEALGYDDISGDGQVPLSLIENVQVLDLRNKQISDLTGIEDFTSLTDLNCYNNDLSSIDISNNTLLTDLNCANNTITSIDVSSNTALTSLSLYENQISSIDISANILLENLYLYDNNLIAIDVSKNTELVNLRIYENNLTSLDVSTLTKLVNLNFEENTITSIDVTNNTLLQQLNANQNDLSSINASNNTALTFLSCTKNTNLSSIDITGAVNLETLQAINCNLSSIDISDATNLDFLNLSNNNLTAIDLSNNPNLTVIDLSNNDLQSLDVRNQNLESVTTFNIANNDDLTCISVTNPEYANETYGGYYNFSKECGVYTYIADANFEAKLNDLGLDDILGDYSVPTANISAISGLDIAGADISDLTGIEDFVNLTSLDVSDNNLTQVDVSSNTNMQYLEAQNNQIESLDLSLLTSLTELDVSKNDLFYLNLQNNNNTNITFFDAINNPRLECILVDDVTVTANLNQIDTQTSFSATDCTYYVPIPDTNFENALSSYDDISNDGQVPYANIYQLTSLNANNDGITNLTGIEHFKALEELRIGENDISTVDLSQNVNLTDLEADSSDIVSIDISKNALLEKLNINDNEINSLDLSTNINLVEVDISNNNFNTIDLSNNTKIEELTAQNLNLNSSFDISTLVNLIELDVDDNKITTIDLSNNILLEDLDINANRLQSLDISNNPNLDFVDAEDNTILSEVNLGTSASLNRVTLNNTSIESIDVSGLSGLRSLYLNDTEITYLDVSANTSLFTLEINNAALTALDLRNGNNTGPYNFSVTNNPDLSCIMVDDVNSANTNYTNVDAGVTFSATTCGYVLVPDLTFETELEKLGYDDISGDGKIPLSLIENVTKIQLINKGLTDLTGIQGFTSLETLYVYSNDIAVLDISSNKLLKNVSCKNNELETLNVSQNQLLEVLVCIGNNISEIDVSNNPLLIDLNINENPIGRLDVSNNLLLEDISIENTNIISLDLSNNPNLEEIYVSDTPLVYLNAKNGNNINFDEFVQENNPNLICVTVDDVDYAMNNWSDIDNFSAFTTDECTINAYTAIPDPYFEERLYNLGYDDILGDAQVPTVFIQSITSLDLSQSNISDITGIADFTSLEILNVSSTGFTDVDLSGNTTIKELYANNSTSGTLNLSNMTALEYVECFETSFDNLITTGATALKEMQVYRTNFKDLDVSTNTALEKLLCYESSLATLNTTGLTSLKELIIYRNSVEDLDLSTNTALEKVECYEGVLETINTEGATALKELYIQRTNITDVDIASNTNLAILHCHDNSITALDVSTLSLLEDLNVSGSNITTLDLSANPNLSDINARFNALVSLDLRNGNNTNISNFNTTLNDDLACIMVDDITYAGNNFTNIDSGVTFSTSTCGYTLIPDANFEQTLEDLGYDDISQDGKVPTANIEVITSLDLDSKNIADITGLEDFIALQDFSARSNSFTEIDISSNVNIITLDLFDVNLTEIDLTALTNLQNLSLSNNAISAIDISNNILLEYIAIQNCTSLTAIDLSQNVALERLSIWGNALQNIDLNNNTNLTSIVISQNNVTAIDFSQNILLEEVLINENPIEYIDVSGLTNLVVFVANDCDLSSLNIKNGNNTSITYFSATNNPDFTCVSVDDTTYATTNWTNIDNQTTFNEVNCDSTAPIITLLGDDTVTVEIGNTYTDAGATATDDRDGDLTSQIAVVNPVDTAVIGSYTITYNVTDAAGNAATQVTRTVNVVEPCPIIDLPANNFVIQAYSETCSDKNNGIIFIDAAQELNYIATINSENYTFNNTLVVSDLTPGTYPICITVEGYSNCEQCFELVIQEASLLTGKTILNTDTSSSKVLVEVDAGTAPYTVLINDKAIGEYTTNSFYVEVKHGDELEVVSSVVCEGKLSKSISLLDDIRAYPNPTRSDITLILPSILNSTVKIEIHNTLGVLVTSKEYSVVNGSVVIPMYQLSAGVYFVTISGDRSNVLRIVKE